MMAVTIIASSLTLLVVAVAESCPAEWRSGPGSKCYKVYADGEKGHGHFPDCKEYCSSAALDGQMAAPACITSKAQNDFIVNWMKAEDSIAGIPGRRSTRYFFWIGNYQATTDQAKTDGWTGCVSGEVNNGFTAWSPGHINPSLGAQPDDRADFLGAAKSDEDCAAITADGWYDFPCTKDGDVTMYCMCELGASWVISPGDTPSFTTSPGDTLNFTTSQSCAVFTALMIGRLVGLMSRFTS